MIIACFNEASDAVSLSQLASLTLHAFWHVAGVVLISFFNPWSPSIIRCDAWKYPVISYASV
jgi:hypothetical protein